MSTLNQERKREMDLSDLKGYPLETQVALLASSYFVLSKAVESMESKLDVVIEESTKKKGSSSVWDKLFNAMIALATGGGGAWAITASKGAAAVAVVTTTPGGH